MTLHNGSTRTLTSGKSQAEVDIKFREGRHLLDTYMYPPIEGYISVRI